MCLYTRQRYHVSSQTRQRQTTARNGSDIKFVFARLLPRRYFRTRQDCDAFPDFDGDSFEPRCRVWYQDAIEEGDDVIFTNPYEGASTGELTVTAAAAVYNPTGDTLLGVVGLDIDFEGTKDWIVNLRVIGDDGYAYLLAPGGDAEGEGQMAIHKNMDDYDEDITVYDLETGLGDGEEEDAFRTLVARMEKECDGAEEYDMGGAKWILAWSHETVSMSGDGTDCGSGGFIAVVTVAEDVLLEVGLESNGIRVGYILCRRYLGAVRSVRRGAFGSAPFSCGGYGRTWCTPVCHVSSQ